MGTENNNPFVLPGFGQSGDAAQNPLMASMEMMRRAWQGMAGAGGLESVAMATPMSTEDLERRISDLRAVENWLRLNLSMLSSTIQGLEVQRSTIATLMSFAANAGGSAGTSAASASATPSPLEAVLGIKPGGWSAPFGATATATPTDTAPKEMAAASSPEAADQAAAAQERADHAAEAATAYASSAETAVKGWWDMLQKQFDTLASATAASLQSTDTATAASADSTLGKKPAKAGRKSASKPAAPASAKSAKPAKPAKAAIKTPAKAAKPSVAKKAAAVTKTATRLTRAAPAGKTVATKTTAKRTPARKA